MKTLTSCAVFLGIALICAPANAQISLLSENFDSYTPNMRLPDPPYELSDITGVSGDNPGIDTLVDPTDAGNQVGGRQGANSSHHATMRELSPPETVTEIQLRADFMTDWSGGANNVDNLIYAAGGPGDRDLLIGLNDGLLSAFFEDSITPGGQRLRGNGGAVVTAGTWYTVRATVIFPGSDLDGLLTSEWKLASQPDTSFASMMGGDSNTTISAPDLTQANWFHWELRNCCGTGGSGGSYVDNISLEVPDPPPAPTDFVWNSGSGDWNTTGNWNPTGNPGNGQAPQSSYETVTFAGAISSNSTVFTDTPRTVNQIAFDNAAAGYFIAGPGGVHLDASTAAVAPRIDVLAGSHEFQTPLSIHDNTTVDVDSGATLTLNNALNLAGNSLTKSGGGDLVVNNVLSTGGGTLIGLEGTISGSGTIGGDVNNGGGTISPGNNSVAASGVPEPAGFVLIAAGLLGLVGLRRSVS